MKLSKYEVRKGPIKCELGNGDDHVVFFPMCGDIIHSAHVEKLKAAANYGSVTVLLMTDEAIRG